MSEKKQFIVGKKVGMTQHMSDDGVVVAITIVKILENQIVRVKTLETDGYNAICLGYGKVDSKKINKPNNGQFKGDDKFESIKEFRVSSVDGYELNSEINLDSFEVGKSYDAQSKTIGRGYSGTVKAWGFRIGPKAHGSKSHRIPGSIGQATYPGEVNKGKKMYRRYGNQNVTIQNLELVSIEGDMLYFKGAIPGKKNVVYITGDN